MRAVKEDEGVLLTFLNRPSDRPHDGHLLKPLCAIVVALILLTPFYVLATSISEESNAEDVSEIPASCATITTSSFAISPMEAFVGEVITFTATATSDTGTDLTFTIYYDFLLSDGVTPNPDSPVSVNVTGNPGMVMTEFVYDAPGPISSSYVVRLSINDGTGAPLKNITKPVRINENTAPYFAAGTEPEASRDAILDYETFSASLNFSVTCMDDDNDNLTLTWDFGDGTEPVVQVTGPALVGVECLQNHTWIMDPEMWYGIGETEITYYMNLSLTDGFDHWTNTTTLIRISLDRHNFSPTGNISVLARIVDPADTVTIYGNASDAEGEPLTWTFVFSNSSEIIHIAVYQTGLTEPGEKVFQNTTYIFSTPGNYTVALYLTDLSLPELQIDPDYASHNSSVGSVTISSVSNRLPSVLASISIVDCYTGLQDPMLSEVTGIALVGFSIQANDLDGDVLYATWDFGDGSEETYNVSDGGTSKYRFNQTHSYSRTGQFNVSVIVTDGRPGHEVLRYRVFNITSFNNSPELKSLKVILSNSSYGLPGSVVRFELYLFDLERDSLEVRWDFGDGSPAEYTNVTVFDENGNVTIVVNHTYGEIGTYRMWVNFTDRIYGQLGYHQEYYPSDVVIRFAPPAAEVDPWSWWDYTSLAILILAIVLLILWSVIGSLKRRRIDSLGMTKEEYLLRKKKIDSFDEKHRREEDIR